MRFLPAIATRLIDVSLYLGLWKSVTGLNLSTAEFLRAGERIHVLERYMNTREGIDASQDTLPQRLLTQGRQSDGRNLTVPLAQMKQAYYRLRGYDADGRPEPALLKKLRILP